MSWHECWKNYFKVHHVLQSHKNVDLEAGMNVHLMHVGMPQGGAATRKKHYGLKLSKFFDNKQCIIRMKNKDKHCLARTLVMDMAWQERDSGYGSWLQTSRYHGQRIAVGVPESLCGLPEVVQFQEVNPGYSIIILSAEHFNPIVYKGQNERNKFTYIIKTITLTRKEDSKTTCGEKMFKLWRIYRQQRKKWGQVSKEVLDELAVDGDSDDNAEEEEEDESQKYLFYDIEARQEDGGHIVNLLGRVQDGVWGRRLWEKIG